MAALFDYGGDGLLAVGTETAATVTVIAASRCSHTDAAAAGVAPHSLPGHRLRAVPATECSLRLSRRCNDPAPKEDSFTSTTVAEAASIGTTIHAAAHSLACYSGLCCSGHPK